MSEKQKYELIITDKNEETRTYPLDHKYRSEDAAAKEAEDLADHVYQETDIGWTVSPIEGDA